MFAPTILDRLHLDDGALQRYLTGFFTRRSEERQGDLGPRFAAQALHRLLQGDALGTATFNLDDAISGKHTGTVGGGIGHGRDHRQVRLALFHGYDDAHSTERSFGVLLELVILDGLHEFAVRIQR